MRFSWIQDEWEDHYIERARNTILALVSTIHKNLLLRPSTQRDLQMHEHRRKLSRTPEGTTADSHVQPTPIAQATPAQTRFKLQRSAYDKGPTRGASTVEAEFRKYVSGPKSSPTTDILRFWEVRDSYD